MHSKHMIYIIYTSAITFLRVNTQKLKTGRIFNLHVQINKEINSPVKSSLKYVQLINATAALSRWRSKYFFFFFFVTQHKKQHSSWEGVGTAKA